MKKYLSLITLLSISCSSVFSCTNQTVNSTPSNKPSISSTSSPQVSVTPTPEPTPSQDENIISSLPPILAFGNPNDYYKALNKDNESSNSDHIFYMNDKVLKEGITKEAILNKDIVDVTEGTYPEYSPDNKLISFIKTENEKKILYIMKAGDLTGKTKQIISELNVSGHNWINNNEILFNSDHNLYTLNIETKIKKTILENSYFSYSLSPNKKKIAIFVVKYSNPSRVSYNSTNKDEIYQSLFIYDIETQTKDMIVENKLLDYIKSDPHSDSYRPLYYFVGGFKWNENNEDIAFPYYDATKIVKISTKTKELTELFDLREFYSEHSYISKIFYYGKNGNLLFLSDTSGGSYDMYPQGIVLSLKNTPVNKNAYLVNTIPVQTYISKEKYLDNIYFYYSPYNEYISFFDMQEIFSDYSINLKYKPLKYIIPYSFLH